MFPVAAFHGGGGPTPICHRICQSVDYNITHCHITLPQYHTLPQCIFAPQCNTSACLLQVGHAVATIDTLWPNHRIQHCCIYVVALHCVALHCTVLHCIAFFLVHRIACHGTLCNASAFAEFCRVDCNAL